MQAASPSAIPGNPAPGFPWRIFWSLLAASLLAQALIYGVITSKNVIRSDGLGYYLYLPAALVHRDLTLETTRQREFAGQPIIGTNPFGERTVIKYPAGTAVLTLPFFLVAWGVATVVGVHSVLGWPYQAGVAAAGAFYFALGGCCVWRLLRPQFGPRLATLALVLTAAGTNLFHYATYDAGFSHIYSFFLAAALLVVSARLPASVNPRLWAAWGLIGGLIVITRPTNVVLLLFPVAFWLADAGTVSAGCRRLWTRRHLLLGALLAGALPLALQMAYWKFASGHWLLYSYGGEGFNFSRPALLQVLFSIEKGWFVHLPLSVIAVWGWFSGREKLGAYFPVVLIFMALNLWIIASWHDWGYGGSFGPRPLVEASPLVALGLANTLAQSQTHRVAKWLLPSVAALCVAYTCLLMLGYWLRTLPFSGATWSDLVNSLLLTGLSK